MRFPFDHGAVRLTSPYGNRELPGTSGVHGGVDLVGLESSTVVSVVGGIVAASDFITDRSNANWMWGQHVIIAGDDGRVYFYFHLAARHVSRYDRVVAGQPIGVMGNTGFSFGAHLHFEVRMSDAATTINAAELLGIPNAEGVYQPTEKEETEESMTDAEFEKLFERLRTAPTGEFCSPWAVEAAAWARRTDLFRSDGDGNYRWTAPITREELAVVLFRFSQMNKNE